MAKGNVKNVSIAACAQGGYWRRANPASLDPVGPPWGPEFGKWGPLIPPESVKCLQRSVEQANPEQSEGEAQCGFHKHHFCFLECQEISLMCT